MHMRPSRRTSRLGVLGLLLTSACATADLRPKDGVFPSRAEVEGRAWIEEAAAAQGAVSLSDHQAISFWLKDEWPGAVMRALGMPWPENGQRMRIDARVGTDDGRLEFIGGEEAGTGWGLQQWVTYRSDRDRNLSFDPVDDPDDDIKFWIPTTLYFPLLVWRVQEADVLRSMGTEQIGGRSYHLVFASWGEAAPQDEVDQYVVYIDEETHLVKWVRYTVRDVAGFAVGHMLYGDYREVGGLKFPFSMMVVDGFQSTEVGLHAFTVDKAEVDPELPADWFLPRPDLRAGK